MEGSTKSGYVSDRSVDNLQKLRQAATTNLKRLRNLTPDKIYTHFINFIYKDASLLVIYKEIDTLPGLQHSKINIACSLLDSRYSTEISRLSNLAIEKIEEYFQDGGKCLGAFYNGQLIAYSWCHNKDHYFPFFNFSVELQEGVYIGPNFVAPEFRGNKIHCCLLKNMMNILYEEGCSSVFSSVLENNHASIKGLISAGFIPQKKVHVRRVCKTMVYKNIEEVEIWNHSDRYH